MDPQGRIPLRRGSVCGLLLIVLGLWGGLAPLIGPYLHFGYTPDKTWHYSSGRLYYSIIPAAAVLVGGLLAVLSRNRGLGIFAGLVATLGGIWFSLGQTFVTVVLKKSFPVGKPILHAGATLTGLRATLETLLLFGGLGLLVVLVGALAMGRFSMIAATDIDVDTDYSEFHTGQTAAVG
ncbi:MAG TPA: hypothetical protein VEV45_18795 [Streptosporangiaceae bacterium]|nr:hypothetical protein [Streptosporangiaceae bacterium]